MCRFFRQGRCNKGKNCEYSHQQTGSNVNTGANIATGTQHPQATAPVEANDPIAALGLVQTAHGLMFDAKTPIEGSCPFWFHFGNCKFMSKNTCRHEHPPGKKGKGKKAAANAKAKPAPKIAPSKPTEMTSTKVKSIMKKVKSNTSYCAALTRAMADYMQTK